MDVLSYDRNTSLSAKQAEIGIVRAIGKVQLTEETFSCVKCLSASF